MITLHAHDWWVILTASLAALACGLAGVYLVLRRLSMLGDAISHAILPGLAGAFILTGSRDVGAMLLGAAAVGLLTALLSSALHRVGQVHEDAALGVVFTTLFALGVLLISWVARDIDLDPGCVLYGLIEFIPFDTVRLAGLDIPRAALTLALASAAVLAVITLFHKEIRLVAFDPYLATTMGFSALLVHGGLLALIAGVTVVSFESVGTILVVTMLIAPGATAHLLTDRFGRLYALAAVLAVSAAVLGYLLALRWNTSVAGMISVVAGAQFAAAALLAPRHGVLGRVANRARLALRIAREDVLGLLYRWHERAADDPRARPLRLPEVRAALDTGWLASAAVATLRRRGEIARDPDGTLRLTPLGLTDARQIVRTHRLWELYLARHLGLKPDHLHAPAHRVEHFITPALGAHLADAAGPTAADPHGRPIPPPASPARQTP